MTGIDTTRDDAPAYLLRYASRRAEERVPAELGDGEPPFLLRARERATRRALAELDQGSAPPGRTEAFARETVAPRELQWPEPLRRMISTTVDVRLIRHGQTQGYVADSALTPLGRWQSHRKGQDLAKGLQEGMRVKIVHAPTARAGETAVGLHEGLLQAASRYGIHDVTIEAPRPVDGFRNFQVWRGGDEVDVTAAFYDFANVLEGFERSGDGERPGWMVELDRLFRIQFGGGDPITYWLNQPLNFLEPPIRVVRRYWQAILDESADAEPGTKLYVCAHSGPIRAVAATAVGHDPGEPNNVEDVRIRLYEDRRRATLTYRGRGLEIDIPTVTTPTWHR
jgi:broad specificity phosphatase PhoE